MELHSYQKKVRDFIIKNPYCGVLLDMGLGKTLATLAALEKIKFNKVLVVSTLLIAKTTWKEEVEKWKLPFKVSVATGGGKKRVKALMEDADIYTINAENLMWLTQSYPVWPFDVVILDESSLFRNPRATRFRALKNVRPYIKRLIELTGTPIPRSIEDIWAQMYLLDEGKRLERFVSSFRVKYLYPMLCNGPIVYKYGLRAGAFEAILDNIKDITISVKSANLKLPERIDNYIHIELDHDAMESYKSLQRHYVLGEDVTAVNAGVLTNKLLQLATGAIYKDNSKEYTILHSAKIDKLIEIVGLYPNSNILILYNFIHEKERILQAIEHSVEFDYDTWISAKGTVFVAHPGTVGHGLNLQDHGNIIIWFSPTHNLELFLQTNKRLHRQGQKNAVIINYLLAKDTVDTRVMAQLDSKNVNQNALIEGLRREILGGNNDKSKA